MNGDQPIVPDHCRGSRLRRTPLVMVVIFLLLLLAGIALDEPSRVLEQARAICLSCIGIG